jgi:hypothetical protein
MVISIVGSGSARSLAVHAAGWDAFSTPSSASLGNSRGLRVNCGDSIGTAGAVSAAGAAARKAGALAVETFQTVSGTDSAVSAGRNVSTVVEPLRLVPGKGGPEWPVEVETPARRTGEGDVETFQTVSGTGSETSAGRNVSTVVEPLRLIPGKGGKGGPERPAEVETPRPTADSETFS